MKNGSHEQELPARLCVIPVLCDSWEVLNRLLQCPEGEDVRNGIASLVGRPEYGVCGPWHALRVPKM